MTWLRWQQHKADRDELGPSGLTQSAASRTVRSARSFSTLCVARTHGGGSRWFLAHRCSFSLRAHPTRCADSMP